MSGVLSLLATVVHAVVYRADHIKWRLGLSRYRTAGIPASGEAVLFCDVVSSYSVSKAQSLFAVVFRQMGCDSIVLLDRPNAAVERNYRAAGVRRFFYLSQLSQDPDDFRSQAEEIVSRYDDLNDLLTLEIDNVRVGRNVLSKTVRGFRTGRLNSCNPEHRRAIIDNLSLSLATSECARRFLAENAVRTAFFCERGYTPAGEIFDACTLAGIDAIQWASAPMDGTLLFKRYRVPNRAMHALSLSDESWRKIRAADWSEVQDKDLLGQITSHYDTGAWYNRQQLQEGKTIQTRQEVQKALALDPAKKTAVIFCHILYDATFFYGDSLFSDYQTWLVETVRSAFANPALNWVIKAHPVNVWRSRMDGAAVEPLELNAIKNALGELPDHVRFMPSDTPVNTYSLFDVADYGLTVRGTIGLELPCFGIPVITAGTGRYSGHGFTIDPENPDDYRSLLASLQDVPPLDAARVNLARRYAYATLRWRPLPLETFSLDFGLNNRLAPSFTSNVTLAHDAPSDLTSTPDLGHMAAWALRGEDPDLLVRDAEVESSGIEREPSHRAEFSPVVVRRTV